MNKSKAKTARGILRAAAHIIRERGWTQRSYENMAGQVCLYGAVYTAMYGNASGTTPPGVGIDVRLEGRVVDILYARVATAGYRSPVSFNDAPGRTAEQVIAILEDQA
jgi:hypothetical protein